MNNPNNPQDIIICNPKRTPVGRYGGAFVGVPVQELAATAVKAVIADAGISGDVVTALGSIKQAITNVSEYVTSTAAAVEEQSTVTSEMSSSMQRAAAEASETDEERTRGAEIA